MWNLGWLLFSSLSFLYHERGGGRDLGWESGHWETLGQSPLPVALCFLTRRVRTGPAHSNIPSGLAALGLGTRSAFLGLFASYENLQKISACFRFDDKLSEMSSHP